MPSASSADTWKIYAAVLFLAPIPRDAFPSERSYITTAPDGSTSKPRPLPCWHEEWLAHRKKAEQEGDYTEKETGTIDNAEVEMSVVIPAYNEEERLSTMLEEAIEFLDATYGRKPGSSKKEKVGSNGSVRNGGLESGMGGYEVLLVNDGSCDKTVDVALDFSRRKGLHDVLRICTLKENRGKGGAVTHGLRHVRGAYAIFADADGASRFSDLLNLVKGCSQVADEQSRGIAVGSRAHLVGSEAVVKVCTSTSTSNHTNVSNLTPALCAPKRPHALLSPSAPPPNTTRNIPHPRYAMRIQALLARHFTTYSTVYARRRLDLRCGDVDVG